MCPTTKNLKSGKSIKRASPAHKAPAMHRDRGSVYNASIYENLIIFSFFLVGGGVQVPRGTNVVAVVTWNAKV